MLHHLISVAHEPNDCLLLTDTTAKAWKNRQGEKTLLSLTRVWHSNAMGHDPMKYYCSRLLHTNSDKCTRLCSQTFYEVCGRTSEIEGRNPSPPSDLRTLQGREFDLDGAFVTHQCRCPQAGSGLTEMKF